MENNTPTEPLSLGGFSPSDADSLLQALLSAGIEPEIEVDDGIRKVSSKGSGGIMAQVTIFVPPDMYESACSIRDEILDLCGEV
jgi:hypothetical protein